MKAAEDEAGPASDLDARPTANLEGRALTARSWRLIAVSLTTVSIAVFAVWGWLAVVHLNDRYRIDHVSGVHMALAWDANHGVLYPPLYDGHVYGGTRYMPVPILLDAVAARVTGSYLVSGKALSYAYFIALAAVLVVLLRKSRCPWPIAIGLVALIPATEAGLAASMNARSDTLPVLLQIGAVGLIRYRDRASSTPVAAAIAALALVTKVTAVWGAIAIVLWLLLRSRRRSLWFLGLYAAFSLILIGIFAAASDGRLVSNVFGLSTAGTGDLGSLITSPYRFFHEVIPQGLTPWALVPFVVVAVWWGGRRDISIWSMCLGAYLVILMIMLADRGVGWNQLIDLVVLAALIAGEWIGRLSDEPYLRRIAIGLLAATVLWASVSGLAFLLGPDIKRSLDPAFRSAIAAHPLSSAATRDSTLLSEDPYVPVSLDRRPVVLDPFMLIEIGRRQPAAVDDLVARIEERQFDIVVLRVRVDDPSKAWWFEQWAFGSDVATALRANYVYDRWAAGYHTYRPR